MRITNLEDIAALRESSEIECKLAQGRDSTGEMPKSAWESYSAFANTDGGYIILGLEEQANGSFRVQHGIRNTQKVVAEIITTSNNPQKISSNLVHQDHISIIQVDGKNIVILRVPRASRQHRPVFVGGNPLTGAYQRLNDADCVCSRERVKRMLAEQQAGDGDDRILAGFNNDDLHIPSINAYRNLLRARAPTHPFLEYDLSEFLEKIKVVRKDRETHHKGITVAGLLMFGNSGAIRDEFPNYALDYQERDDPRVDRWTDRVTTDDSWPGNLFEFFRLVWRRLSSDVRVPFQLVDGQRVDETPVHTALREALVNTLVHADYTCRASVLIVKRPDMFGFRNPGMMRVPIESAVRGGESDSRNRVIQQMFLMMGAGERAGSGLPKIHKGWREQHWRPPVMVERTNPSEQTLLELRMEDLLPTAAVDLLRSRFGEQFDLLGAEDRVILATAAIEQTVSHARAMTLCDLHPADLTRVLQALVQDGFLVRVGQGRGSLYHLTGTTLPDPDIAFGPSPLGDLTTSIAQSLNLTAEPSELASLSLKLEGKPLELIKNEPHDQSSNQSPVVGKWIDGLSLPLVDDVKTIDPIVVAQLSTIAQRVSRGRMQTAIVDEVLIDLCAARYISIKVLASLIGRAESYLRQNYLNRLVATGRLHRAFPAKPNDPRQAYTSDADPVKAS